LDESIIEMEFQTTDAYFNLGHTRVIYKTQRQPTVEIEEAIQQIKPNIFKP
jgi:hypothetical protein